MTVLVRRLLVGAALVVSGVLVVGASAFALAAYRVDGASMAPTLAKGELIAVNPFAHAAERFDVVVLRPTAGGQPVVKRVIALPGDRIQIAAGPGAGGESGTPRVRVAPAGGAGWFEVRGLGGPAPGNHKWRTRIECCGPDGRTATRPTPATVPEGRYFVLGDNPDESIDSRTLGWIKADAVRAVVLGRAWPPAAMPVSPALVAAR